MRALQKPVQEVKTINRDEIYALWASGAKCYARHEARALYIVDGEGVAPVPACGDHVSRALREVPKLASPPLLKVTVWVRP